MPRRRVKRELRAVRKWQIKHKLPIFVGEIGCPISVGNEALIKYFDTVFSVLNEYKFHWFIHAYREYVLFDVMKTGAANTVIERLNT